MLCIIAPLSIKFKKSSILTTVMVDAYAITMWALGSEDDKNDSDDVFYMFEEDYVDDTQPDYLTIPPNTVGQCGIDPTNPAAISFC